MSENETELTCENYAEAIVKLNNYFRNDDVISGIEHSSKEMGYAVTAAYFFVIVFGATGNFLTILVVLLNPAMRTTRNFFILNLALSDFFVCTVTAPITLYTVLYLFWPFGMVACKVAGSLQGFNVFLSTFSVAAIALDRYVLIIFPTNRQRQQNLSLLFFVSIWVISLVLAFPLFIASDLQLVEFPDCEASAMLCHEQNDIWTGMWISKKAYTLGTLAIHYAFPLFSIVFAYTRIAHRMKMRFSAKNSTRTAMVSNQRRRSVVDRQRRTNFLLICVVVVFAVAWLPLNVFHLTNTFEWSSTFPVVTFAVCHITAMFSSCCNPLIYAFFNHNFRAEFIALFQRLVGRWIGGLCTSLDSSRSRLSQTTKKQGANATGINDQIESTPVLMESSNINGMQNDRSEL